MNLDQMPTPETHNSLTGHEEGCNSLLDKSRDLERRLTVALLENEGLSALAKKTAEENMELLSKLTVAREALKEVHKSSSSSRLVRVAFETLTQTSPK